MPEAEVGKGTLWPGLSQDGAPYQSLPTRETKPKTMWSCMWNTLPNLTNCIDILCPRSETHWCVWLGQGSAYQVLPINPSGLTSILM